jgi:uncharacterized protein YceK
MTKEESNSQDTGSRWDRIANVCEDTAEELSLSPRLSAPMWSINRLVLLLCLILAFTGCGTISTIHDPPSAGLTSYAGVVEDMKIIDSALKSPGGGGNNGWSAVAQTLSCIFMPFAIVDLPLSFAGDTLLLPYTIPHSIIESRKAARYEEQQRAFNQNIRQVYELHRKDHGTLAALDEVLKDRGIHEDRVLRSMVIPLRHDGTASRFIFRVPENLPSLPDMFIMGCPAELCQDADDAVQFADRSKPVEITYWYPGKKELNLPARNWVLLDVVIPRPTPPLETAFNGRWRTVFTFEKNTKHPAEQKRPWLTFEWEFRLTTNHVSGRTCTTIPGILQGEVKGRDLTGTMRLSWDPHDWESLKLQLDESLNSGTGSAVFGASETEKHYYTIELKRR